MLEFCFERITKKCALLLSTQPDQFEIFKAFIRVFLARGNMRRLINFIRQKLREGKILNDSKFCELCSQENHINSTNHGKLAM